MVMLSAQPSTQQEKRVQLLLRLIGAVLCTAFFPMLFPRNWIEIGHDLAGLQAWPAQPISWYFARSLSLMYFVHGAFVLGLSTDVARYWPLIKLLGGLNLLIGAALTLIDLFSGMPPWWTIIEGPSIITGALLLLWMMRASVQKSKSSFQQLA